MDRLAAAETDRQERGWNMDRLAAANSGRDGYRKWIIRQSRKRRRAEPVLNRQMHDQRRKKAGE